LKDFKSGPFELSSSEEEEEGNHEEEEEEDFLHFLDFFFLCLVDTVFFLLYLSPWE
jgi:hypothetical protein